MVLLCGFWCLGQVAHAQQLMTGADGRADIRALGKILAGTKITIRTGENIDTRSTDGRLYQGVIDRDVFGDDGSLIIPKGSQTDLVVRRVSDNQLNLDLYSVRVHGWRYGLDTTSGSIPAVMEANQNGVMEIVTAGGRINVPAGTMLTFRLTEPTPVGSLDMRQKPGYIVIPWSISLQPNANVTWQAPADAQIYLQVDDCPAAWFASGSSGTQAVPVMVSGHRYVFILMDDNGREVARTEQDLR
jgi:hypothetical protein